MQIPAVEPGAESAIWLSNSDGPLIPTAVVDETRVPLFFCSYCRNPDANIQRCSRCANARYCDAYWLVNSFDTIHEVTLSYLLQWFIILVKRKTGRDTGPLAPHRTSGDSCVRIVVRFLSGEAVLTSILVENEMCSV
jgi:hypothetical protein